MQSISETSQIVACRDLPAMAGGPRAFSSGLHGPGLGSGTHEVRKCGQATLAVPPSPIIDHKDQKLPSESS